ncbi:MAG: hypothetical protein ACREKI_06635, partial [Gemmatimonadota bacterium]
MSTAFLGSSRRAPQARGSTGLRLARACLTVLSCAAAAACVQGDRSVRGSVVIGELSAPRTL